jgi:ligand-binding SRPBCC domain-containing protein
MVRDLLTKKWIVIKKDQRVHDLAEVAMFLETLGVPL